MLLHLNYDRGFETFLEIADYYRLIRGLHSTKFYKDWLKMLKVGGIVLSFFQLVLKVLSKLTPDAIDKGLGVPKVLSNEVFELRSRDRSGAFVTALALGLSEADGATEKNSGKGATIYPCDAWSFEIILTLLTKVIAIHVRFSEIVFQGPSFKWMLSWLCQGLGLSCLYEHFYKSGEEIFSKGKNKR